jgi:hypothetical protein
LVKSSFSYINGRSKVEGIWAKRGGSHVTSAVALASTKCSVTCVDPATPSTSQHLSLRERVLFFECFPSMLVPSLSW